MKIVVERVYPKVDFDRAYPFHGGTTISGGGGAAFVLWMAVVGLELTFWRRLP